MSIYSGRCDCFDSLIAINQYTEEELKNNVKIFIGSDEEPLKVESYKSLIPYYPYLIVASYHNGKDRTAIINLSNESFVDREERERLDFYLKQLIKIYNRCKRKKIEFNVDEAVKEVYWISNKEAITELAERVKRDGKKATVDGIHLDIHEYYRQELVNEMIKNGINAADYGYQRFLKGDDKFENTKEQL